MSAARSERRRASLLGKFEHVLEELRLAADEKAQFQGVMAELLAGREKRKFEEALPGPATRPAAT